MKKPSTVKEFFNFFGFVLPRFSGLIVITICTLLITFLNSENSISMKIREIGENFSFQILEGHKNLIDLLPDVGWYFNRLKELSNENSFIKAENQVLNERVKELEAALSEQQALNKELNFITPFNFNTSTSRVSSLDVNGGKHFITSYVKDTTQFTLGAPVIFNGNLIGKITSINSQYIKIQLITDMNFKISAVTLNSQKKCIVKGMGTLSIMDATCLEFDPRDYQGEELIVTAGNDGIFPYGIVIGKFSSNGDEFKIRLEYEVYKLRFVQIVNS